MKSAPNHSDKKTVSANMLGEAAAIGRVAKIASPVAMATPVLKVVTFHSSSLGNLLASLPALVALRDSFPGAKICSYVRAPLVPLLQNFTAVDEAYSRPGGGISSQAALMARLHGGDYNLAVSFSQGSNALLLLWATRAPIRAGFVPSRMDAFLTHRVEKGGTMRQLDAIELVRSVGATPRGEKARDFLNLPFETTGQVNKQLDAAGFNKEFLVVATEKRKRIENKGESNFDSDTLAALAQRFPLVLVGLKSVSGHSLHSEETNYPILDLRGKTDVLTLVALCERARGVLSLSGGVAQLARFLDRPVVSPENSDDLLKSVQHTFGF